MLYRLGIALLTAWLAILCGAPDSSGGGIIYPTCYGVNDTAALTSAIGGGGQVIEIPAGSRCSVDHLNIPTNTTLQGASIGSSTLIITGTGGGRCGPGANGGLELLSGGGGHDTIANLTIQAVNPALDCLINISAEGGDVPHVTLANLRLYSSLLQLAVTNPIALYTNNVSNLSLDTIDIDGPTYGLKGVNQIGAFRQQWLALGDLNGVSVTSLVLHPNSSNWSGGVYSDSNPMVSFEGNIQNVYLYGWVCEQGPTCLHIGPGTSGVQISGAWSGDGVYHCKPWRPSYSYRAGTCVVPPPPQNYAGHIYVTPHSGRSAGSTPGFPTPHNATVADGSVTWIEYGRGSMFDLDGSETSVSGNLISGIAGVSVYVGANAQGVSISGNQFYAPSVAAVYAETASGLLIAGNHNYLGSAMLELKGNPAS